MTLYCKSGYKEKADTLCTINTLQTSDGNALSSKIINFVEMGYQQHLKKTDPDNGRQVGLIQACKHGL